MHLLPISWIEPIDISNAVQFLAPRGITLRHGPTYDSRRWRFDQVMSNPSIIGNLDLAKALLAIEEIKQLRSRYFHAVDTKNWSEWAGLFTDDVILDFRSEMLHQVRDPLQRAALPVDSFYFTHPRAAADAIKSHLATCVTVHRGYDPQVTLTGSDTATGIWAMWDCLDYGDEQFQGYGHYYEEYRCTSGRWLISRLKLTRQRTRWEAIERPWTVA
jgi:hypothetical protein